MKSMRIIFDTYFNYGCDYGFINGMRLLRYTSKMGKEFRKTLTKKELKEIRKRGYFTEEEFGLYDAFTEKYMEEHPMTWLSL